MNELDPAAPAVDEGALDGDCGDQNGEGSAPLRDGGSAASSGRADASLRQAFVADLVA